MNCTDVAAILDNHALSRLSAADHCALDEHVTGCEPCALAWSAHGALIALPVPAMPIDLLRRMSHLADPLPERKLRSARLRFAVVAAALAAGAALAAVTGARLLDGLRGETASVVSTAGAPSERSLRSSKDLSVTTRNPAFGCE